MSWPQTVVSFSRSSSLCAFGAVITSHSTHGASLHHWPRPAVVAAAMPHSHTPLPSHHSGSTSVCSPLVQPNHAVLFADDTTGNHNRMPSFAGAGAIHEFGTARTIWDWCLGAFHPALSCVRPSACNMLVPLRNRCSPSLQHALFFPRHSGVAVGVVAASRDLSMWAAVTIPRTRSDGLS